MLGTGNVSVLNTSVNLTLAAGVSNAVADSARLTLADGGTAGVADVGYPFLPTTNRRGVKKRWVFRTDYARARMHFTWVGCHLAAARGRKAGSSSARVFNSAAMAARLRRSPPMGLRRSCFTKFTTALSRSA